MRRQMTMKLFPVLAVFLLLYPLSGCTPAMSGISGTSLTRTAYPRLTMTANPPLVLQGHGRQWVSLPTEFLGLEPSGVMDYAVYGEGQEGPITRHAHVLVVEPTNDRAWYFQPEGHGTPGALTFGRQVLGGYTWTAQVLRVNGPTDWFSAMWAASGRETPELWIARRFSGTPTSTTRTVAEYREPWPECLDPEVTHLLLVSKSCLEGFFERSEAAFSLDMHGMENIETPSAASQLRKPDFAPDIRRLAGELRQEDTTFFRHW